MSATPSTPVSRLRESPWWILLFVGLGVVATISVITGLFFSLGRRPRDLSASSVPAVQTEEFLAAVAGAVHGTVHTGGTAELLRNGNEFYPAMLAAIRGAERSVTFLAYIWEDGEVSDRFLDSLVAKARSGIAVRLLLDGLGSVKAPRSRLRELEAATTSS